MRQAQPSLPEQGDEGKIDAVLRQIHKGGTK